MSALPTNGSLTGAPPRNHLASNSRTYRSASVPYSAKASPLRGNELRRKHQERAEHQAEDKEDEDDDLYLEISQRGPEVENSVRNHSGQHRPVCQRNRDEGVRDSGKKPETTDAVRVCGNQAQFEAGHLPEEARPDNAPIVPAH